MHRRPPRVGALRRRTRQRRDFERAHAQPVPGGGGRGSRAQRRPAVSVRAAIAGSMRPSGFPARLCRRRSSGRTAFAPHDRRQQHGCEQQHNDSKRVAAVNAGKCARRRRRPGRQAPGTRRYRGGEHEYARRGGDGRPGPQVRVSTRPVPWSALTCACVRVFSDTMPVSWSE